MADLFTRTTSNHAANGSRFGRNGIDPFPSPQLNGNGQSPPPREGWAGRLGILWDRYAPFRNPFSKKGQNALDDDADDGNGVHAITKKTDYWFNRELYSLEQEAKHLAT